MSAPRLVAMEIRLQWRQGFHGVYLVMTGVFLLVLAALPPELRAGGFLLVVLLDPALMGFFFAGALVLLERDQGILQFVVTRGRGFAPWWRAKVAAIGVLALVVVTALYGVASRLGFISLDAGGLASVALGLTLTLPLFFSLGVVLAAWKPRVIDYFVYSSIVLTPFMFPLLAFTGAPARWWAGYWGVVSPLWGGVVLFRGAIATAGAPAAPAITPLVAVAVASLVAWNVIAWTAAKRAFGWLAGGASGSGTAAPGTNLQPQTGARQLSRFPVRIPADLRLLLRDRITAMVLCAPILAAAVLGRGIPAILSWAAGADALPTAVIAAVTAGANNLRSFSLLLGALMYGMVGGLLYLDEKDEGVLPFLRTLPGRRGWFILRRTALLIAIHTAALPLVILTGNLLHPGVGALRFALSLAADALVIPLMFLAMGLLAANKVQGLALAKVLNILCLSPLLLAAVPDRLSWILAVVPGAWGSVIRLGASAPLQFAGASVLGLASSATLLLLLYRRACGGTRTKTWTKNIVTPLKPNRADAVRERLVEYGISADDINDAVDWARPGADE